MENEEQNAVMTTTTTMTTTTMIMMMMMMMMMMPSDGNACLLSVSAMCVTTAIQKFAEDADDSPPRYCLPPVLTGTHSTADGISSKRRNELTHG